MSKQMSQKTVSHTENSECHEKIALRYFKRMTFNKHALLPYIPPNTDVIIIRHFSLFCKLSDVSCTSFIDKKQFCL